MIKNSKNWWKFKKMANTDREILHVFWTPFNAIFKKDLTYDNVKSHKNSRFHWLFGKTHFSNNHREGVKLTTKVVLGLNFYQTSLYQNLYFMHINKMGNKQLMGNIQQLFLTSVTAFKSTL